MTDTGTADFGEFDEATMVVRLKANDTSVLSDVLAAYASNVEDVLRSRFRSSLSEHDIEEVLTEALFILWQNRMKLDLERGTLGGWFYVVCRNTAINKLKRESNVKLVQSLEQVSEPRLPSQRTSPSPPQSLARKIIAELSPTDQAIVFAYLASDGSGAWAATVAQELDLTPNNVRVRWHRIRDLLRRRLLEENRNE